MRFNIEHLRDAAIELELSKQALLARLTVAALLLAGVVCLVGSTRRVVELSAMLHNSKQSPATQGLPGAQPPLGSSTQLDPSPDGVGDFVADLPSVAPSDAQIRYAAKLAHDQGMSVVQMQTGSLKADPKAFGQSRITLQLRGDYRDIKNVWIALLAKYPGLVAERLNLQRHTDGLEVPAPRPTVSRTEWVLASAKT